MYMLIELLKVIYLLYKLCYYNINIYLNVFLYIEKIFIELLENLIINLCSKSMILYKWKKYVIISYIVNVVF